MPQLDPSIFPTQVFWLLITFTLLFLVVWKVALPRIADIRETRRTRIDSDLEKAQSLKDEAEEVLAAYERSLAEAADKAQSVHRNVADALLAERNKKLDEVGHAMAERLKEAEKNIQAAETAAVGDIRTVAGELVQAATTQLGAGDTSQAEAAGAVEAVLGGAR
jgi:F-type H+-transporting ATPase subunit b